MSHEPVAAPIDPAPRRGTLPGGFGRLGPVPGLQVRDAGRAVRTIGELAREFGVSLRTLRFYEQKGLIGPTRHGLARVYGPDERARLATILKGKALGFSLREIAAIVAEEGAGAVREADGRELPLTAIQVRDQIAHLEARRIEIEAALARLKGIAAPETG